MRVFLQVYKELELAIQLGSEYAQKLLKHPNVMVSTFIAVLSLTLILTVEL